MKQLFDLLLQDINKMPKTKWLIKILIIFLITTCPSFLFLITINVLLLLYFQPNISYLKGYEIILNFIATILTASAAFYGIWYAYKQYKQDKIISEINRKDTMFTELSMRASSKDIKESSSAISCLPVLVDMNNCNYDKDYIQESVNIILINLIYEVNRKKKEKSDLFEYSKQGIYCNYSLLDLCCKESITSISRKTFNNKNKLSSIDLSGKVLREVFLMEADLKGSKLNHIILEDSNLNFIDLSYSDIQYANLNNTKLTDAILNNINFSNTNFKCSNLTGSSFLNSNLHNAVFNGSNLAFKIYIDNYVVQKSSSANFENANLSNTQLVETNLVGAIFKNAIFENTDFSKAIMCNCIFENNNLNGSIFNDVIIEKNNLLLKKLDLENKYTWKELRGLNYEIPDTYILHLLKDSIIEKYKNDLKRIQFSTSDNNTKVHFMLGTRIKFTEKFEDVIIPDIGIIIKKKMNYYSNYCYNQFPLAIMPFEYR